MYCPSILIYWSLFLSIRFKKCYKIKKKKHLKNNFNKKICVLYNYTWLEQATIIEDDFNNAHCGNAIGKYK